MVTKTKQLRVCIWPEYYAISYKNPRTGELEGIDIDLAREMAKELKGVTPYAYAIAPGDQIWLNWINLYVSWVKRDGRLLEFAKKHGREAIVEK